MNQYYPPYMNYTSAMHGKREWDCLTKRSAIFVTSQKVLEREHNLIVSENFSGKILVKDKSNNIHLFDNLCLHRQAELASKSDKVGQIVCPLHYWTYNLEGKLKSSPHLDWKRDRKCLRETDLFLFNSFLFANSPTSFDLSEKATQAYNMDGFFFHSEEVTEYDFDWKVFLEVYLENYHVFSMHPGLKKYISPTDLEWEIGDNYSIQYVGLGEDLSKSATTSYKDFQNQLSIAFKDNLPRYGAIWGLFYPNLMLERYPGVIVISTVWPIESGRCKNVVQYFYQEDLYIKHPEYFDAHRISYQETASEDEQACLYLQRGRYNQARAKNPQVGPFHDHLEKGVREFYNWLGMHLDD